MIRVPYMKISQRNEVFFLTRFRAVDLKKMVSFHFRQAYSNDALDEPFTKYIEKVKNRGINLYASPEGIQRRLQMDKLNKIKDYLEKTQDSFFPNTIILSVDLSNDDEFMDKYLDIEKNDIGFFEFHDDVKFQIVDGQHRLAGLFMSDEEVQQKFDIPVVLLINITLNTCAKIFADVNGNQTPVNKSVIYDLYEIMGDAKRNHEYKVLHGMCKSLNESTQSPLYQHVKMLGIGGGAISQSFMANALKKVFAQIKYDYNDNESQKMYGNIFAYLKVYQRIFQMQWAVLENASDSKKFKEHSEKNMRIDKSQALKTNGLGAIMRAFPEVYKAVERQDYQSYFEIVSRLNGKVNWCSEDLRKGTGDKTQKAICKMLLIGMNLKGDDKSMRKIIVFPRDFAVIDIDYNKDDEKYVARIKDATSGLNVDVPSQQGKSIEDAFDLMKTSLETINNNYQTFVIEISTQMNDYTLVHDCFDLFDVKLSITDNPEHPEAAFNAIENAGIDGKIVDKYSRIYPADSIHQILEMLKEGSVSNYQYRFVVKKT